MTRGLNKFDADLLVVPQNALVNMKTALLTGEPEIADKCPVHRTLTSEIDIRTVEER